MVVEYDIYPLPISTQQAGQTHVLQVSNNWYPGMEISPRYGLGGCQECTPTGNLTVESLAADAKQAMYEYMPLEGPLYRVSHHGKHLDVFLLDLRSYRCVALLQNTCLTNLKAHAIMNM